MLQVYGFIEVPKLLLHGRGKAVLPTILAQHLHDTREGLLVAAVIALHENSKIRLEEADLFFQVHAANWETESVSICVFVIAACVNLSLRSCVRMVLRLRAVLNYWWISGRLC